MFLITIFFIFNPLILRKNNLINSKFDLKINKNLVKCFDVLGQNKIKKH
jgi:hypothetical protein